MGQGTVAKRKLEEFRESLLIITNMEDELMYELQKERENYHLLQNRYEEMKRFAALIDDQCHSSENLFRPEALNENAAIQKSIQTDILYVKENCENSKKKLDDLEQRITKIQYLKDCLKTYERSKCEKGSEKNESQSDVPALQDKNELDRKWIAKELKDSVNTAISASVHKIEFANQLMNTDINRTKEELELLKESMKNLINIVDDLIMKIEN